ncbi:MAG: protein kinase [Kiritimatiellia bacterium]
MSEEQLIPTPSVFGENGNFLLERELGRGGMGGVYLGRDKMLDRPVAVKVMLKEYGSDASFVEKFKKEAQAAARLIHPNIAQVYSYGIADGMPYIAMELVAGGSLDGIMRNQGAAIDIPRVMKIGEQVAQALRCAADQGLVHGDVKPENILLDANGNAKLVDFGLAAMQRDTDEIWGTPYYIAPEKVKKEAVDYRADMYSLGGTIYHALTGVAPFEGDDATAVVRRRFEAPPAKPSEIRPGISPQIDYLVMKMLALNPADRYPSFEALLADFKTVMATGLSVTGRQDSVVPLATPTAGGRKVVLKAKRKLTVRSTTQTGQEVGEAPAAAPVPEPPPKDNLGAKIALFIGGIIGAIVLVVLILWGVTVSRDSSKRAKAAAGILQDAERIRSSLQKTHDAAEALVRDVAEKADAAEAACRAPTEEIRALIADKYTDGVLALLNPPRTKELEEAIASTNQVAEATAEAKPTAAAPDGAGTSAPAPKAVARPTVAQPRFPDPVDDEADPNSPEGQKYLERKRKWEEEQKNKPVEPVASAAAEPADSSAAPTRSDTPPPVVKKIGDMWERAYGCRAAEIRLHKRLTELLQKVEKALSSEALAQPTEDSTARMGELANSCKDDFDGIRGSHDVEVVAKARSFIANTAAKSLEQLKNQLREEELKRQRDELARVAAEQEQARQTALAAAKAKKIEEEVAAAKAKFQAVVDSGHIRQLNWKSARRTLDNLKAEMETAEGQIQIDKELKKVECMELMQNTFIRNLKDYTFKRGASAGRKHLRGCTVTQVDADHISYLKKGGKKEITLPWQTFIRDYHNNFNEIIIAFIVKNGAIGGETKSRLSSKDRFNALTGVALMLRTVCADEPSSADYARKLMLNAVKDFPALSNQAKEFFPDFDFSEALSAAEAEQL